jgi:hypothetical protein
MKTLFKTTILYVLILTGFLVSCKKQDGYSDTVETFKNPIDSSKTSTDSLNKNSDGSTGTTSAGSTQNAGAANTGAQSTNSTNTVSGPNEAKGTGTGIGPGPSAKDGSAYSGPSDPQNSKIKTTKSKGAKTKNK